MSDITGPYVPSRRFDNVQQLLGNHFKFTLTGLPDLTQFAQSFTLPSVLNPAVERQTRGTRIRERGDHVTYGAFNVTYIIDNAFKTYYSLYWWVKGAAGPHATAEISQFRDVRRQQVSDPKPLVHDLEKTTATLWILQPDTDTPLVTISFIDVFPVSLSEVQFSSTDSEPPGLVTTVSFECTAFDVVLNS